MTNLSLSTIRSAFRDLNLAIEPTGKQSRAAVAVLVHEGACGVELLLVERVERDGDPWSGHLTLPGGLVDLKDASPKTAAERETFEEVGIDVSTAKYLGQLDDVTDNAVTVQVSAFVYVVQHKGEAQINHEIHDTSWVPLNEVASLSRHGQKESQIVGSTRECPVVYLLGPRRPPLSGVTHRIIQQLFAIAGADFLSQKATDPVTHIDLQRGFRALGLEREDVLFFHSSLKSFVRVKGGADSVIDSAVEAMGTYGTVVVPTFVQKVNGERATYRQREQAWNIETSPSDVGYVTEIFRKRPDSIRSDHCCDSLAAIGAEATTVMNAHRIAHSRPSLWNERAFGRGSPWDWLVERNALYLLMGVDFHVCSIFHYAQAVWVEKRLNKMGDERVWPAYNFPEMGRRVKAEGLVKEIWVGPSRWQAFRVEPCMEFVMRILDNHPEIIKEETLKPLGE